MATLKWLLILGVAFYGGLIALLYVTQRALQYFPERVRTAPAEAGLPEAEEVILDTVDGERVVAWHVPPREQQPVVLYFHGNGASLRWRVDRFRACDALISGLSNGIVGNVSGPLPGEDNVIGREGRAVTPEDALLELVGDRTQILSQATILDRRHFSCQAGDKFTARQVMEERLGDQ